MRLQNGRR